MKNSKVSVIVPVFNAEKTLAACLDSILSQDYENLEILLINDGSTDRSGEICEEYWARYPALIRVLHQINGGPATARNQGIDLSSGEYLAFVDADDTVMPNMIGTMLQKAEQTDADMVICSYFLQKRAGTTAVCYRYPEGLYTKEATKELALALIDETTEADIPPYSWVRLTKRKVFERTGIRYHAGLVRSEDFHFWSKIHFSCESVYLLSNSQLYNYVENTTSITHRYIPDYWEGVLCIYHDLIEQLPGEEEVRRRLGIMLLRRSLIALNNACRCLDRQTARNAMWEIVKDETLNQVIQVLRHEDVKRYKMYPALMKHGAKALVVAKYMLRNFRYRMKKRK